MGRWILIHEVNMSKDMTGREKLIFILSFVWFMHWGVNIIDLAITNFVF